MGKKENKKKDFFKMNKTKYLLFGILLLFCLVFLSYKFLLLPQIHLKGGNRLVLNYKDVYKEKGELLGKFYITYLFFMKPSKQIYERELDGTVNEEDYGEIYD